jgi:hypothetical protein
MLYFSLLSKPKIQKVRFTFLGCDSPLTLAHHVFYQKLAISVRQCWHMSLATLKALSSVTPPFQFSSYFSNYNSFSQEGSSCWRSKVTFDSNSCSKL